MTAQLKIDLNALLASHLGRELTALELAHLEAAFLRNGFKRDKSLPTAPIDPETAMWECANGGCRWTGLRKAAVVREGLHCCPKCDHTVRLVAANLR